MFFFLTGGLGPMVSVIIYYMSDFRHISQCPKAWILYCKMGMIFTLSTFGRINWWHTY